MCAFWMRSTFIEAPLLRRAGAAALGTSVFVGCRSPGHAAQRARSREAPQNQSCLKCGRRWGLSLTHESGVVRLRRCAARATMAVVALAQACYFTGTARCGACHSRVHKCRPSHTSGARSAVIFGRPWTGDFSVATSSRIRGADYGRTSTSVRSAGFANALALSRERERRRTQLKG